MNTPVFRGDYLTTNKWTLYRVVDQRLSTRWWCDDYLDQNEVERIIQRLTGIFL